MSNAIRGAPIVCLPWVGTISRTNGSGTLELKPNWYKITTVTSDDFRFSSEDLMWCKDTL
ncbi:hypothetical protein LguiA_013919 [Lonicera macranthoides]